MDDAILHLSVISGRWIGDNERQCAMESSLPLSAEVLGHLKPFFLILFLSKSITQ